LVAFIPKAKEVSEEKKTIAAGKVDDKGKDSHTTKVRAILQCDLCGANRVVCSKNMVDSKDGPTSEDLETLEQRFEEDGYFCGMDINGGKLHSRPLCFAAILLNLNTITQLLVQRVAGL